jgi:hypothetical protein
MIYRWRRRWPRWLRRLSARWFPRPPAGDGLAPSPGVAAFLAGDSMRQVAYLTPDPGIVDPDADWPGALADAHGVVRDYVRRLQTHIKELSK